MQSFGELESAIMEGAWQADHPLRVPELLERLRYGHPVAATTVFTVMERLRHKGWLAREKHGRSYQYWATATRAEYAARLMDQALAEGDDRVATFGRFVSLLTPSELNDLRNVVGNPAPLLPAAASF